MSAYLLTWNPKAFDWDFDDALAEFEENGVLAGRWSSGHTKRIVKGDRLFMLRQGEEPRGIIASGEATSRKVVLGKHWNGSAKKSNYVDFKFNKFLDYNEEILSRNTLLKKFPQVNWDTQSSGISIAPDVLPALEKIWSAVGGNHRPKQTDADMDLSVSTDGGGFAEGTPRSVTLTKYERNSAARQRCIEHWGVRCCVCDVSFEEKFGIIGRNYIHVHHVVPISSIKGKYHLDPVKDLRPVCPNCHAMIHKQTSATLSVQELKKLMVTASKRIKSHKSASP